MGFNQRGVGTIAWPSVSCIRLMPPKYPSDSSSARDGKGWWHSSALHSTYAGIDGDLCGGHGCSFIPEQTERSRQSQPLSIKLWSSAEAEPILNNTWLAFRSTLPAGARRRVWVQTPLLIFKRLTFISAAAGIFWRREKLQISGISHLLECVCPCASASLWLGYVFRNDMKKQWEWVTDNGKDVEQVLFSDETGRLICGNRNHPFSLHEKDKRKGKTHLNLGKKAN